MPQIKILDRHKVTQIERTKAAALVDVPIAKKKLAKKILSEKEKQMKNFSTGEKDLYKEVEQIQRANEQKELAELEKTNAYFQKKSYDG